MDNWKETTLADICSDISYGYTESATQEKIGPRFLRITDIAKGRLVWDNVPFCPISESNFEKYKLNPGDIVIARTGATTGANYTIKENDPNDVVYASYLIRYQIDNSTANPFFIGHILQSNNWKDYVDAIKGGSAQPGANAKQLGSYPFNLPPLTEQKAIAEVLSSLDDKIDLLHRQNKTLEAMAETLFRQWFVEPARRREIEGGEAVESWEEGVISDIANHSKISVKPQSNKNLLYNHYSIPSYDDNKKPVKEYGIEIKSYKYQVINNTVLFSKLNPHKDKRLWLIQDESVDETHICSTEFQVVEPHEKENLYFIYGWLFLNDNYREIASGVGGTSGSHQRISPDIIFGFPCPLVPSSYVKKYNLKAEPIFQKQGRNHKQIQTLTNLRDTLLPKLMSGEVRVKMN